MGVIAPSQRLGGSLAARIEHTIVRPTIDGMAEEKVPLRGVLFAGVMVTSEGEPYLLEHNVRFGDPECEALMALVDGDMAALCASVARGELDPSAVRVLPERHACVVVLAAHGYPESPRTGDVITGLEEAASVVGAVIHHAGTAERDGRVVTAGGRVLAVTGVGASPAEARERAYRAADCVRYDGKLYRTDIGLSAR
jgi:phosphoribosylamine--glycine ligase